jgi:hypothetical protein
MEDMMLRYDSYGWPSFELGLGPSKMDVPLAAACSHCAMKKRKKRRRTRRRRKGSHDLQEISSLCS